jgi:hypothetical protein
MALFKKTENTVAFLKMGLYGEAGTGKTFTAAQVAKGLALHIEHAGFAKPQSSSLIRSAAQAGWPPSSKR